MTVFTPATVDEAQDWLRGRLADKAPFAIRGAGTRAGPVGGDALCTTKLDRLRFFEPDDMVVGVEAGMRFDDLRRLLAEKNAVLPVNPWFGGETVGGMVAANDFGPDRLLRGGLRDFIIGMEYLDGSGRAIVAGGKVVKNVAGYDLCRLMVGSLGGLGVITAVNFKLEPAPIEPHIALWRFADAAWVEGLAAVHRQRWPIDWSQALWRGDGWTLALGLSGVAPRRERLARELAASFDEKLELIAEADAAPALAHFTAAGRFGGFLSPLLEGVEPALHLHAVYPTAAFLDRQRLNALTQRAACLSVQPIGGDAHLIFDPRVDAAACLQNTTERFAGETGFISLVRAPDELIAQHGLCRPRPAEYPLMQALKRQLDPAGLLRAPFYEMRP